MKKVLMLSLMGLSLILSAQVVKAEDNMVMQENTITDGKTVKFNYTLMVQGQVADTSEGREPLSYVQGQNMIVPGLEKQLVGLKVGDKKKVTVAPEEAYGIPNPEMVVELPKDRMAEGLEPQVGMILQMPMENGQQINGVIQEIKDESLVLNFNHPLAGQTLVFDIEIVEVN